MRSSEPAAPGHERERTTAGRQSGRLFRSHLEVCRQLRDEGDTPIMLLTARSGDSDKVVGLDLGADDYVVKPFSPRELMARVRSQLRRRRTPEISAPSLAADDLVVDPNAMQVEHDGRAVAVTASEFRLLYADVESDAGLLARRADRRHPR